MWKTSVRISFKFGETKIVCGNKGAGVGAMGWLGLPGDMELKGMGNLFGDKGWEITSCEERLGEIGSLGVEFIREFDVL